MAKKSDPEKHQQPFQLTFHFNKKHLVQLPEQIQEGKKHLT
jgi:hypothetical protein